jgi:GNAT superfamily N-acetyltransferase
MHGHTDNKAPMAPETTTYLEMTAQQQLRPCYATGLSVAQLAATDWETGRDLYIEVGAPWQWIDRLAWGADRWRTRYADPAVQLWTGSLGADVVGYFELDTAGAETELAYFGLRPDFIGRGLGGALLTLAVERAWATGCRRVWVHTSDRDHPAALANYLARGFSIYARERTLTPATAPDSRQL